MIDRLKTYGLLILGGLLTVSVFLLKIFGLRSKRLKTQRDTYRKERDERQYAMEKDNEIEAQTRSRRADAKKEIKHGNVPRTFTDPNSMRNHRRD